ncbi:MULTISPECIES: PDR/VanB family oxidoreductase [Marinomonas]|uniref:Phthalate 4,5-dioxygenase, reductase subunit n=3 Tax=Marinomonas TaxID=28253 RepID=A0A1M5ND67_9GAMM|nr:MULTISPECIES: PDR/VanB family oxidoreductase [Marinomonas]MBR7890303.1 oxidoreductase [Marinomonas vulgaris]RCW98268.1 phthalate 4,5-dioxygenase reductase subunit [Marinomonas foliarum]SHG87405.1 phthalate 4,5-dioxygenase, reductase subunit [Marinomonas polaris DSM 16579]|tara:strand:- start:2589 stop:3518 length:930 start_codon:yes stop_codon:yes gene_type:complete
MKMIVTARRALTSDIEEFTLTSTDGQDLHRAEPGAHITITTPSGAHRRFSLVHPGDNLSSYTVAIKLEPKSRGGSESMHKDATIGTILDVEKPENEFPLGYSHAALLIAGGIGITPIYSMAQALKEEGRKFRVVYCSREEEQTAYLDELKELCGSDLTLHFSQGNPGGRLDFWDLLMTPTVEHIYCCGPEAIMEEVLAVTGHWPDGRVHLEKFMPVEVIRENDRGFTVTLTNSGKEFEVPADKTILEAMRDNDFVFTSSCENGTCGTCKCRYTEGEVDHRDLVLMNDEKDSQIMVCVSRAKGDHLVLDL